MDRRGGVAIAGAALFAVCGCALIATSLHLGQRYRWQPAAFEVDLRPGVTRSPRFTVDLPGAYEIALEVERTIPFEQLNCLLGTEHIYPERCAGVESPVDVDWVVWRAGAVVARRSGTEPRGASYGETIWRHMGEFDAEVGPEYVVEATSRRDGSALAAARPRIVVNVSRMIVKDHVVRNQLLFLGGSGAIAIACVGLAAAWLRARSLRRQRAPGV